MRSHHRVGLVDNFQCAHVLSGADLKPANVFVSWEGSLHKFTTLEQLKQLTASHWQTIRVCYSGVGTGLVTVVMIVTAVTAVTSMPLQLCCETLRQPLMVRVLQCKIGDFGLAREAKPFVEHLNGRKVTTTWEAFISTNASRRLLQGAWLLACTLLTCGTVACMHLADLWDCCLHPTC